MISTGRYETYFQSSNFTVYDAGQLPVSLEEGREGWGRDDVYRRKQQHNPSHLDGA